MSVAHQVIDRDGYRYWRDGNTIRWSRPFDDWPDDGLGIAAHGSAATIEQAIAATDAVKALIKDVKCDT